MTAFVFYFLIVYYPDLKSYVKAEQNNCAFGCKLNMKGYYNYIKFQQVKLQQQDGLVMQ